MDVLECFPLNQSSCKYTYRLNIIERRRNLTPINILGIHTARYTSKFLTENACQSLVPS